MITKKIQLFICLTAFSSICFGQIVKDTTTCLVTIQQLRITNLAFNELDKMNEVNRLQDSMIWIKQSRLDIVTWQRDTFITQLESTQTKLNDKESELLKAKQKIKTYSIAAFLLGSITTIILLY
jgi:hypothetical protein